MSAELYLCANHNPRNRAGQTLLRRLADRLPRPFRACHVGAFHGDHREWARTTVEFLTGLGATCAAPRLSDPLIDVDRARAEIESADLLYLDGGDTVAGVELVRARGLLDAFAVAAQRARFVVGLSGGACAAGPYTIGYRDDGSAYVAPCLDMGAPLPLDVHDEGDDWPEMRALLELAPPEPRGLVIPTHGVLHVTNRGRELASLGEPLVERRSIARDGSWTIERIARATAQ
ncbi:MAG: Type 1 glutamine amidotransferase-like domain-containing protein [Planctomycetes bacterium]|nr:Type 1 glutamine amidotransferase-like domain-containing protein [Planctomycetota bacterium]